ncbi:MAG: class I SAM-dependent methyltransferase [Acetobacteraceae bacterium]|nr:class I SAM-dependent methyltransferase [Acetobacteraceae bacterium]
MNHPEIDAVIQRYARRNDRGRYDSRLPEVQQMSIERRGAIGRVFADLGWHDLSSCTALEVGCSGGSNLADLVTMGFSEQRLTGIELRPELLTLARQKLPNACLIAGDACEVPIGPKSQDVILQFTVFSSLLDEEFRHRLATAMWRWLRPGGGILWYDFTINNPFNPDVRGISLKSIPNLFPAGRIKNRRITLAPPLARIVCRVHPALYSVLNALPLLRTHVLSWIEKPDDISLRVHPP